MPPVAILPRTALALGVTAGPGLRLWLLLARTVQAPLGGASWLALVQVHGFVQLFGFAGLFVMGVGLHLLPRLRGGAPVGRRPSLAVYLLTVTGVVVRAVAQPAPDF